VLWDQGKADIADVRPSITEAAERLGGVVNAHFGDASEVELEGWGNVVGHSMGGLVGRVWMGLLGRWPWCRADVLRTAPKMDNHDHSPIRVRERHFPRPTPKQPPICCVASSTGTHPVRSTAKRTARASPRRLRPSRKLVGRKAVVVLPKALGSPPRHRRPGAEA
jgi:hypothetical protein